MPVEIGELSSTIHVTDSQALLDPRVMAQITAMVAKKVREMMEHERRVQDEAEMRPGASARKTPNWT